MSCHPCSVFGFLVCHFPILENGQSFPYRAKALFALEEAEYFGLHIQEYGSECAMPNASMWTPEDDDELIMVVDQCRIGDHIPWNQVSYKIDGRTRLQIINRWTRSIAPSLLKTPWSNQEDAVLIAAVKTMGFRWTKISDLLPGRSNFSCRERYTNVLVPGITVGNWTTDEDRLLIKLLRKYPNEKWTTIASYLPTRTDNMCLQRATRLRKHHPHLFDADVTVDIDEELGKLELFTRTHNCVALNSHRDSVRKSATRKMEETIMDVNGYSTVEEAQEVFSNSKKCWSFLLALSKKLLSETKTRTVREKVMVKRLGSGRYNASGRKTYGAQKKPKPVSRQLTFDPADSDEDDITFSDPEDEEELYAVGATEMSVRKHESTDEENLVDGDLYSICMPMVYGFRPLKKSKFICQSPREALEFKLLKRILYKQEPVSDDDEVPVVSCSECARLNSIRRDCHLLHRRFMSIFLWPALLTTMHPSPQQRAVIIEQETAEKTAAQNNLKKSIKRGRSVHSRRRTKRVKLGKESISNQSAKSPNKVTKTSGLAIKSKSQEVTSVATRKSPRRAK